MVYIPFPRQNQNGHDDLETWRLKVNKREGDWKSLKPFLAEQPRLIQGIHPIPKCWYSELPQGDNYALDVEHFRPKNQASPLTEDQCKLLEKGTGFKFRQAATEGAYSWLEFDHRNYRLVTATPNRGGAKHIFFPIAENTARLSLGTFPWTTDEYPYLLDPANPHDASLLLVLRNGEIIPRAAKTDLIDSDFDNIAERWQSDGFNYIRAAITIQLYRLNEPIFQEARGKVYNEVYKIMRYLEDCIPVDNGHSSRLKMGLVRDLTFMALPSAPFSLAARCALAAYVPPMHLNENDQLLLASIPNKILNQINQKVNSYLISWENQ